MIATILPTVSVIMPVYNAERYLRESVQSILDQTYADFEFLIVNDGSSDGSFAILEKFADRDKRIRLISRPNTGYVFALNEMLQLANGKYIARMDADDIAHPSRFENQLQFLEENESVVGIGSRILLIDPCGRELMEMTVPYDHLAIDSQHLNGHCSAICHPCLMFRRSCVELTGYYNQEYMPAEDVDFLLRLAEHGALANIRSVDLKYRVHSSSVGHSQRLSQLNAAFNAANAARIRRNLPVLEPRNTVVTDDDPFVRWAWWALSGQNVQVAREYAFKALKKNPFALERWRLLYCTLRSRKNK